MLVSSVQHAKQRLNKRLKGNPVAMVSSLPAQDVTFSGGGKNRFVLASLLCIAAGSWYAGRSGVTPLSIIETLANRPSPMGEVGSSPEDNDWTNNKRKRINTPLLWNEGTIVEPSSTQPLGKNRTMGIVPVVVEEKLADVFLAMKGLNQHAQEQLGERNRNIALFHSPQREVLNQKYQAYCASLLQSVNKANPNHAYHAMLSGRLWPDAYQEVLASVAKKNVDQLLPYRGMIALDTTPDHASVRPFSVYEQLVEQLLSGERPDLAAYRKNELLKLARHVLPNE